MVVTVIVRGKLVRFWQIVRDSEGFAQIKLKMRMLIKSYQQLLQNVNHLH